jgi:SAM-dependent methyltransferase
MMDDADVISSRVYRYQIAKRNQMLARELAELQPRVALDLGCGVGFHSLVIDRHTQERVLISDLSENALAEAMNLDFSNPVMSICCDARRFRAPAETDLDFVHIAGLLHHIPQDIGDCIASFSRYLQSGGHVVVDEPSIYNPLTTLSLRLSSADPTGRERPLSARHVGRLFERNGYRIALVQHYGLLVPPYLSVAGSPWVVKALSRVEDVLVRTPARYLVLRWRMHVVKT